MKNLRRYRLEIDGKPFSTTTHTTAERAQEATLTLGKKFARGTRWRVSLRDEKGRGTTTVCEGNVQ